MTIIYREPNSIFKVKEILSLENPNSILFVRGNKSYETSGAKDFIESQIRDYKVTHLSDFRLYPSFSYPSYAQ